MNTVYDKRLPNPRALEFADIEVGRNRLIHNLSIVTQRRLEVTQPRDGIVEYASKK